MAMDGGKSRGTGTGEAGAEIQPACDDEPLGQVIDQHGRPINEGRAIGMIGIHNIDWKNRLGETEIAIGEKEFWSKGYGTEATMVLLHYAFDTLNLRKMHAAIYGFNKASQVYKKKCGYQVEGVQRQHVFKNGEYHDRILVAVFREDWLPIWERFQTTGRV